MQLNNYIYKNIAILGFGIEGESAVNFLLKNGAKVSIFDHKSQNTFDQKKINKLKQSGVEFYFGKFPNDFSNFDLLVKSPGVNPNLSEIQNSIQKGIKITSPTQIFFELCSCKVIGVTGTKGKGTTASLIYEMLKKQNYDAYLGGNIGNPPLDFIDKLNKNSWAVLELSSFQLQDLNKSPHVAIVLMMTSEHLDYHKDTKEYIEAKRNILRFQTSSDFAIINKDYPASNESDIYTEGKVFQVSREGYIKEDGCYVRNETVYLKLNGKEERLIDSSEILLPGRHNLENVCAASIAATIAGVSRKNIIEILKTFKGLEHRLELVTVVNGVRYYDDSFSTTPETAIAAIEAFTDPEILILGGSSKGSDFTHLGKVINEAKNIKAIIGIGVEWPRIKSNFQLSSLNFQLIEDCQNMREIVEAAAKIAKSGDVVLLSPACASFDMFKNYKDRGEQFKKEVNNYDQRDN